MEETCIHEALARQPCQDAHDKWEEKRRENCDTQGGSRRIRHEKVDINTFRREEEFAEFYDEGSVLPLNKFLVQKGFNPVQIGSELKQRRFVEEE